MSSFANPDCPQCSGSGWVRVPDGGAGAAKPCECQAAFRTPGLIDAAGIPVKYASCSLDNFRVDVGGAPVEDLIRARNLCNTFLDRVHLNFEDFSAERGLLFIGSPGVGKTHLAVAVLKELIRRLGARGRFIDFTSCVARLQSTFDPSSEESKHQVLDPILNTDVLVLDELAAAKPTPFVQDVLHLIINTRYSSRRMTIFTTNFSLREREKARSSDRDASAGPLPFDLSERLQSRHDLLSERLPPMLVSRIREMAHPIEIHATDYRTLREAQRA